MFEKKQSAPVAQWKELRTPKAKMGVQFPPGAGALGAMVSASRLHREGWGFESLSAQGEVPKWFNGTASKAVVLFRTRGFESHPLRGGLREWLFGRS